MQRRGEGRSPLSKNKVRTNDYHEMETGWAARRIEDGCGGGREQGSRK